MRDSLIAICNNKLIYTFERCNYNFSSNLVDYTDSRAGYFASRLKSSMSGLGKDSAGLSRQVVSRAELNLETVKGAYLAKYGSNLSDDIKVIII